MDPHGSYVAGTDSAGDGSVAASSQSFDSTSKADVYAVPTVGVTSRQE